MKFHQITMVGRFNVESKATLPTFDGNRDKGRLVYNESDDKIYFGTTSAWTEISSNADLTTHTSSDAPGVHNTGTMANQDYDNVSITGGIINGITDITVADGGTGASTAEQALKNLGTDAKYAWRNNNLSDLDNSGTALSNLGANAKYAWRSNSLSDLGDFSAARFNIRGQTKILNSATNLIVDDHDKVILLNYSGGSFDVTLPAHTAGLKFNFIVINSANNGGIIDAGAVTIRNTAAGTSSQRFSIISANSEWHIIDDYAMGTFTLGGDFGTSVIHAVRNGRQITLYSADKLSHTIGSNANSNAILPPIFQPKAGSGVVSNVYVQSFHTPNKVGILTVSDTGYISVTYRNTDGGLSDESDTIDKLSISYISG